MSLRDGMNVRLRGGIQIPVARCEFGGGIRFDRTKFLNDVDYTCNAFSYESAMGFWVANPTFLKGLEGL
jgi:hypothetical protein